LGDRAFPEGATARTLLSHITVTLTRVGARAYEVMAMRSMAATLVREVAAAMRHVAARDAAG
jgi:sarcosine oxidase subunit gamma